MKTVAAHRKTCPELVESDVAEGAINTPRPLTHLLEQGERGLAMQATRLCTMEGCNRPLRARGYCATHWARWRNHGTPEPWTGLCTVADCDRKSRSRTNAYCEMHYYRLRRTGTTDPRPVIHGPCLVDGCDKPMEVGENGFCRMHNLRQKKRGDLHFEMRGENHPRWTGAAATARAVHQRVRAARGSATSWGCIDCARPAAHWSYDHSDPTERLDAEKGPYSLDIDRYFPRCVQCHKRFDMDYLAAARAAA